MTDRLLRRFGDVDWPVGSSDVTDQQLFSALDPGLDKLLAYFTAYINVELGGVPNVGVGLVLVDADGVEQLAQVQARPGGVVGYEWIVEPGAAYHIRVEQPPFNVIFTFDRPQGTIPSK